MKDKLSFLRTTTTVVVDTCDITASKCYRPQDASTNPSLILNLTPILEYRGYILTAPLPERADRVTFGRNR